MSDNLTEVTETTANARLSDVPMNLLSHERREMLHEWGFECSCELCSSPTEVEVSDHRKQRIQSVLSLLERSKALSQKTVTRLTEEVLELSEKEGMLAQIGDFHYVVAKTLVKLGMKGMARDHVRLAVEKLAYYGGLENSRTKEAFLLLKNLDDRST